jgi:hypothetical protein
MLNWPFTFGSAMHVVQHAVGVQHLEGLPLQHEDVRL